jgi:hypothetical protein
VAHSTQPLRQIGNLCYLNGLQQVENRGCPLFGGLASLGRDRFGAHSLNVPYEGTLVRRFDAVKHALRGFPPITVPPASESTFPTGMSLTLLTSASVLIALALILIEVAGAILRRYRERKLSLERAREACGLWDTDLAGGVLRLIPDETLIIRPFPK